MAKTTFVMPKQIGEGTEEGCKDRHAKKQVTHNMFIMPVDAILLGVVRGVRCKQDAAFCLSLNFVSRYVFLSLLFNNTLAYISPRHSFPQPYPFFLNEKSLQYYLYNNQV